MTLRGGLYQIRWVPEGVNPPFIGGVYATGESIDAPIFTKALGPPPIGEQTWNVRPVEGKRDTYTIAYPGFSPSGVNLGVGPVLPGWGFVKDRTEFIDLVILSVDIAEWVISVVDAEHSVYRISEPSDLIGAIHAVTEESNRVYVKSYPVVHEMPPLPRWEFISVNDS